MTNQWTARVARVSQIVLLLCAMSASGALAVNVEKQPPWLPVPASIRAQAIADYAVGQQRDYSLLEEVSHNGQARRIVANVVISRISSATGRIELSSPGQNAAKITAPMTADGMLHTKQPDIANAYNGAVTIVRLLRPDARVGQSFELIHTFASRQYREVAVPMRIIVKFADADRLEIIGDGDIPGTATLMGEAQPVQLHGHCEIHIRRGVLEHSAWSLSSFTMRQDRPPDTLSWSLYAPGERIPGAGQRTI